MRRVGSVAVLLVASCVGLTPLTAFGANPPNYFVLKGGVYAPESEFILDRSPDKGFNGEVAFGHYFLPFLAIELGVGYFESTGDWTDPQFSGEVDIWAIPVTLNLKGVLPLGNLELYGLAGIGYYFTDAEVVLATVGTSSDSDGVFGFQLGGGASFNITKSIFIGAEVKYFWLEPEFELQGIPPDQGEINFDGWLATGNLGFRF